MVSDTHSFHKGKSKMLFPNRESESCISSIDSLLSFAARPEITQVTPPPMEHFGSVGEQSNPAREPVASPPSPLPYVITQDDKKWDTDKNCTSPYLNADADGSLGDNITAPIIPSSDAPRFCPQEEEKEWAAVTPDEMQEIEKDLGRMQFGGSVGATNTFAPRSPCGLRDCRASDENDCAGLADEEREAALLPTLEAELAAIPEGGKSAYLMALQQCPELVGDDQKKGFLLKEGFDAKLAAKAIVLHWQYRLKLFRQKSFLPITMCGSLSDDMGPLADGFLNLLPEKDHQGRSIIFLDPSQYSMKYPRESVLRAFFYLLSCCNEDTINRRNGVVLLVHPKKSSFKQFDQVLLHSMALLLRYTVTLLRSIHFCQPDSMFHVIKPMIMHVCGPRMRKRLRVHYGSNESVLQKLAEFGLSREKLPSALGGSLELDPVNWLSTRMIQEDQSYRSMPSLPPDVPHELEQNDLDLGDLEPISLSEMRKTTEFLSSMEQSSNASEHGPAQEYKLDEPIDHMAKQRMCDRERREMMPTERTSRELLQEDTALRAPSPRNDNQSVRGRKISKNAFQTLLKSPGQLRAEKESVNSQSSSKASNTAGAPGGINKKMFPVRATKRKERRQDPRMARAVDARIADPHMSLFDALVAGGFVFPGTKQAGDKDKNVFDSDRVSLHQRKNQLCRRLRAKRKDDPRMSCAVAAKLNDPSKSLVDALLAGGFEFCDFDGTTPIVAEKNIRGLDNVSLYSRKKELIRKLAQLESIGEVNVCNPAA